MNREYLNKILNIIIYFLIIVLICLLSYNLFLVINKNYNSPKSYKNSIEVGHTEN